MPSNPRITIPAPGGMDGTIDKRVSGSDTAQYLSNLSTYVPGRLSASEAPVKLLTLPGAVQGVAYFYGGLAQSSVNGLCGTTSPVISNDPSVDDFLMIAGGKIYASHWAGAPTGTGINSNYYPSRPFQLTPPATLNADYFSGTVKPQFIQYKDEMVILGSLYYNLRYTKPGTYSAPGTGSVYGLGLCTPPTGLGGLTAAQTSVSGGAKTGTISYSVTITDDHGRESDLSADVPITITAGHNAVALSFGPYIARAFETALNFYVNTNGNISVRYLINSQPMAGSGIHYTYTDSASDATVQSGRIAGHVGQNLPPTLASVGTIHKQRLWLNDAALASSLQCSNFDSITQFNAVGYQPTNPIPTDGLRFTVGTENDSINALVSFGDLLYVFNDRGIYAVYGDDASNFTVVPVVRSRGCISVAGAVLCDNAILFLAEDGVYAFDGNTPVKISKPIENALLSIQSGPGGRYLLRNSVCGYFNRKYVLYVGDTAFVYDFESQGSSKWSLRTF